eukprot:GILK01003302.1.p1 GENE.GILK01003302.1~~GILK01003302.1.p1  ORF type:complete len:309 (-),score=59.92 GILK01003302.1:252-1139(-)
MAHTSQVRIRKISEHLFPSASAARYGPVPSLTSAEAQETMVLVERINNGTIAIVYLNRPKSLNALCDALVHQLSTTLEALQRDRQVRVVVLAGKGRAFAAGADIKEMDRSNFTDMLTNEKFDAIDRAMSVLKKPLIGAVHGFALGGGCEVAMMCDIIIASEDAKFGQPEIKIGTIPGLGGTQRLTRAVGKSKAMEMVLTGEQISAQEALQFHLVSAVVPADKLMETAIKMAEKIAALSKPVVAFAKDSVNAAYEMSLREGLRNEKRMFISTFALDDRKEGMTAFASKRKPAFRDQ